MGGCTVLVAIPGSFLIPLMIWTPAVMKLGAPSDAAVRLREKRHEREGTSPRAPSPRAVDGRRASGDQVAPPFVSNPVHNMSVDSLAENKVPKGPEEEAEGLSRQLSEVGRAASNQDSGDDVARSSLGAGDKPTLRSSFKKQRSVRLAKAGGLSELLTADAQMDQLSGDG